MFIQSFFQLYHIYFTLIVILMVFFVPFFKVTVLYNPFSYRQFQIL